MVGIQPQTVREDNEQLNHGGLVSRYCEMTLIGCVCTCEVLVGPV